MAAQSDRITRARCRALTEIRRKAPEEYDKLEADSDRMAKLNEAAANAATESVKLAKKFANQPYENIADLFKKHLPEERIKLIQDGLSIPTFQMDITKSAGISLVQFTRGGEQFLPARTLATSADIDWATIKQYASIIVEAVMLVMSAVGISVSPSSNGIGRAVEKAVDAIKAFPELQKAMEVFIRDWNNGSGWAFSKAKAMLVLIDSILAAGILLTIIKTVCGDMPWYDWLVVAAMIIAALTTGRDDLILAQFAIAVTLGFEKKITNVVKLSDIKQSQLKMHEEQTNLQPLT